MDAAVQVAKEKDKPSAAVAEPRKDLADLADEFGWLPCQLTVEIPIVNFTVGDLLLLKKESIVETCCPSTGDIPLRANGLLIARSEFEVIGKQLALRITELA
jgi:flagellar motor switch/type III secretory pathway protein FliN